MHCSCFAICGKGLKGNRVQIPDSPAAVSFKKRIGQFFYATDASWEGAHTGSKSEDLQRIFFDGFEERPEENARTLSGFYYSLSKVFLSSRLMVSDNYFAIIIRERSMNLTDGMSSVCKMHAFFAFKGLGYSVNTL